LVADKLEKFSDENEEKQNCDDACSDRGQPIETQKKLNKVVRDPVAHERQSKTSGKHESGASPLKVSGQSSINK
jgi:hypothetical protein